MLLRKLGVTVTIVVGAVTILAGCDDPTPQTRLDFSDTENVAITAIRIEPGEGEVVIRTGELDRVEIKRRVEYWGDQPSASYRIDGTTLILDTDCGIRCGISYDILAPKNVAVTGATESGGVDIADVASVDVQSGSGHISVTRVAGTVAATSDAGQIVVSEVKGNVRLESDFGGIEARRLSGTQITAVSDAGEVLLELLNPANVTATTESGGLSVTVPPGDYTVKALTGSGEKTVEVASAPVGKFTIDVRTDSGSLTVRDQPGV